MRNDRGDGGVGGGGGGEGGWEWKYYTSRCHLKERTLRMLHKHQLFRLILFIKKKTINEIVFFIAILKVACVLPLDGFAPRKLKIGGGILLLSFFAGEVDLYKFS